MGTETDAVEGWHFLREDRKLNYNPHTLVEPGQTLTLPANQQPKLCEVGFHASRRAIDALSYAPAGAELFACRVTLTSTIVSDTDKLVASARTCHWMVPARRVLIGWAAWAATGALLGEACAGRRVDPRSWAAIEAVDQYLRSVIGQKEIAAAAAAAAHAASAPAGAAYAAAGAARAAAHAAYAAAGAAGAAAAAAAHAAYAAAGAAAREALNSELERRLQEVRDHVEH